MTAPEQFTCDVCHKQLATHHICFGGTGQSSHLCDECFETSAPAQVRQFTSEMRKARCQYCGAPAKIGTMDHLAISSGEQRTMYLCHACSAEFNDYTTVALKQVPDGLSQQQQLEAIQRLRQDAEQHMKQWVSERRSR